MIWQIFIDKLSYRIVFQDYNGLFKVHKWQVKCSWKSTEVCKCRLSTPVHACMCVRIPSCVPFFATPGVVARQSPVPFRFSRQEYWSRLPFPSPGYLPSLGIKSISLVSPALLRWVLYQLRLSIIIYKKLEKSMQNISSTSILATVLWMKKLLEGILNSKYFYEQVTKTWCHWCCQNSVLN